jgi:hypothetical protein
MKRARPPARNRDTESRRLAQAAAARKRRLLPLSPSEPAAPDGDAPDPTAAPVVEVTDQTASPRIIQPGLRQYQAPVLQQPPQPGPSSGVQVQDTPLPLRVSEVQGPPTVTGGKSPPMPPPGSGDTGSLRQVLAPAEGWWLRPDTSALRTQLLCQEQRRKRRLGS